MCHATTQNAIAELDSGVPVYDIRTMEERIARSLTDRRMLMLLTAGFGVLALLREGAVMLSLGLLLGLVGAAALQRAIESHLYGVSPLDPGVLILVVLLMSAAAFAACLVPARRATRVNPAAALAEP